MAKQQNKVSFYDKLLKHRALIMIVLICVVAPLLFGTIFLVSTAASTRPNPFDDTTYFKTTLKEINDTKIKVEEFTISNFYGQTPIENGKSEFLGEGDGGYIKFYVDLGAKIDKSIVSDTIKVKTYVCYNWVNYTSKAGTFSSVPIGGSSRSYNINDFETDWNKRPFLLFKVNLDDAIFHTSFTWKEKVNNEEKEVTYVFTSKYKDLITKDTLMY